MKRFVLHLATLAGVVLTLGACVDSPTQADQQRAPDLASADVQAQGCGGEENPCPLPPISNDDPCDPYLELDNSCDDDTCMTSVPEHGRPNEPGRPSEAGRPSEPGRPGGTTTQGCTGGGGPGGGPGDGGDGPGGPGGGGTPDDPDDPECNPQYDPDCNQPLTSADSTTLKTGFQKHINTQFTDPAKAAQCKQLKDEFDRLMASGNVYRGAFDTPENDPHTAVHVGAYDPVSGTMHFEPSALDSANAGNADAIRNIVNTALHEAAHSLGYDHTDPVMMGNYDLYAEPPFDLLSPGTNSCITGW